MKFQPFITSLRSALSTCMVVIVTGIMAQVPTSVQFSRNSQQNAHLIHYQWQDADEQTWKAVYDHQMDKMGLQADLKSASLLSLLEDEFLFFFQQGAPSQIECLISVESIAPDETVQLIEIETGRVMVDFKTQTKRRFMTPAFDPSQVKLHWTFGRHGEHKSVFTIDNIYYSRHDARSPDIGFGTSLTCHPNVVCKTDSMDVLISNSAVRIRVVAEEGSGYCTGALVNNTRNDKTPYVLTAFHCQWNATPIYDQWRFDLDYVSPTCPNPATEPAIFSLHGCERISGGQASDYLLLKINEPVPDNKQATFAGWNRDDVNTADTSYHIHHPKADIRKFSTSTEKAIVHPNTITWSEGYTTPGNHHIRFEFTEGGHEAGSSGGPVFDQDGFLIGQLHGGTGGCEAASNTLIGRFSKSWNLGSTPDTRLRDWLDPDNTGVMTLQSLPNVNAADLINIEGVVLGPKGAPCVNAVITIGGSANTTMYTDALGRFQLSGVDRNGTYVIEPEKTAKPNNGLNVLDVLAIQKHSLGKDTFDFPWQYIAADATNNGEVSVGDMLQIMRLLLGKITAFTSSPSWRFDPPMITLSAMPPGEPALVNFMAIKIGDVNGTADPSQ